ncbi:MAG: transcriptional regulator [Thiotrichales bacterium]|nr:MAG: transcriptional regulator [Thiotrichales bacterium]
MSQTKISYTNKDTKTDLQLPVSIFKKPKNDEECDYLQSILDKLVDEVRGDESHELTIVMEIIGNNIELYDDQHHPAIGENISDIAMVKHLMSSHDFAQKDLTTIFGGQANVSKFLSGKRPLNKKQIAGIKETFNISADFFIRVAAPTVSGYGKGMESYKDGCLS